MNVSRLSHFLICNPKPLFCTQNLRLALRTLTIDHVNRAQKCQVSNIQTAHIQQEESLVKKLLNKIPFFNVNKTRLMASGYLLYENIADKLKYEDFFVELDLPDTFCSWFSVTELHIWMISVRAMAEGEDGRLLRNYLVEALWNDVAQRIKRLGMESNPSIARHQVSELSEQLQAALLAYDEGLLSDDSVLAGALWRRFYQQGDVDPRHLEILVKYVRRQLRLLDLLSKEQLIYVKANSLKWIPLNQ